MMKTRWAIYLLFLFISASNLSYGQEKAAIDASLYGKWPRMDARISNDGNFITVQSREGERLCSKSGNWKIMLPAEAWLTFSPDSKLATYLSSDTLKVIKLGTSLIRSIPDVKAWTFLESEHGDWLCYLLINGKDTFIAENLSSGIKKLHENVSGLEQNYLYSHASQGNCTNALVLKIKDSQSVYFNFASFCPKTGELRAFYRGESANNFTFDDKGKNIAFLTSKDTVSGTSLWYVSDKETFAQLMFITGRSRDSLMLNRIVAVNSKAGKIFIQTQRKAPVNVPLPKVASVDVYSYADPKLMPLQLSEGKRNAEYIHAVDMQSHALTEITRERETLLDPSSLKIGLGRTVLVRDDGFGDSGTEGHWNRLAQTKNYAVNVATGARQFISYDSSTMALSPDEDFVVYYKPQQKQYFSYEIATAIRRNLTVGVKTTWTSFERDDEEQARQFGAYPIAGWDAKKHSVLLHDQYDLYQADLTGHDPVINLTGGYGKRHQTRFRRLFDDQSIVTDRYLNLAAFSYQTKASGFFRLDQQHPGAPQKLIFENCLFSRVQKARDTNRYVLIKERLDTFPNVYQTTDFRNFIPVTDQHPEKKCNWLKSELITWQQLDGQTTQGILYKPEHFDPKKKYPVIFRYYERLSDELHEFKFPGEEFAGAMIDVPTFVSHGYIVVDADIHFKIGNPGQAAYNSVVACARHMSKFPWVDQKRMGLNGHSYAGYMTDYIVTHTNRFAAAISGSSWSNFISASDRIRQSGHYAQDFYEVGKQRMGGDMWDKPGNYIQASPIFQVHRVNTPLLMMNNKKDDDVDFYEGVQFFTALRRLGKTCWMLQYDGEGHVLYGIKSILDYMKREQQFFDYYLKGAQLPKWMAEGIPANQKGTEDGFELEQAGVKPPANLLIKSEQKRIDLLQKRKPATVIVK